MKELFNRITAFLDRHHMEPTTFGIKAIKDGHLYSDLRAGKRKFRRKTIARIEAYMAKRDARLERK